MVFGGAAIAGPGSAGATSSVGTIGSPFEALDAGATGGGTMASEGGELAGGAACDAVRSGAIVSGVGMGTGVSVIASTANPSLGGVTRGLSALAATAASGRDSASGLPVVAGCKPCCCGSGATVATIGAVAMGSDPTVIGSGMAGTGPTGCRRTGSSDAGRAIGWGSGVGASRDVAMGAASGSCARGATLSSTDAGSAIGRGSGVGTSRDVAPGVASGN